MLKICIFMTVAVIPFVTPTASEHRLYDGQTDFFFSMLKSLEKENPEQTNIFSPHSTFRVLLLIYLGIQLEQTAKTKLEVGMHLNGLNWADSEANVAHAYTDEKSARERLNLDFFKSIDRLYYAKEFVQHMK